MSYFSIIILKYCRKTCTLSKNSLTVKGKLCSIIILQIATLSCITPPVKRLGDNATFLKAISEQAMPQVPKWIKLKILKLEVIKDHGLFLWAFSTKI